MKQPQTSTGCALMVAYPHLAETVIAIENEAGDAAASTFNPKLMAEALLSCQDIHADPQIIRSHVVPHVRDEYEAMARGDKS